MIKFLVGLKPFVPRPKEKKPKHCSTCGSLATLEAHFDAGYGVTMIVKYYDACSKKIAGRMW